MWIYTERGELINLDHFERVVYENGTNAYRNIEAVKRLACRISEYDVVDEIATALREGKQFLEV